VAGHLLLHQLRYRWPELSYCICVTILFLGGGRGLGALLNIRLGNVERVNSIISGPRQPQG